MYTYIFLYTYISLSVLRIIIHDYSYNIHKTYSFCLIRSFYSSISIPIVFFNTYILCQLKWILINSNVYFLFSLFFFLSLSHIYIYTHTNTHRYILRVFAFTILSHTYFIVRSFICVIFMKSFFFEFSTPSKLILFGVKIKKEMV